MLKRIFFTIISSILMIFIFANISYSIFTPYIYKSPDGKIIAYAELNIATITLTSGEKIHSTNVNGGTTMKITTITTPIELVLVVDTSGSMEGDRIAFTKDAISILVSNLYDIATNVKVHLIEFNSSSRLLISSSNENDILSNVNYLYAEGGTYMTPALLTAKDILNNINNKETKPYLVVLTDGETEDMQGCYNALMEINQSVPVYNVLIGMPRSAAFTQNGVDAGIIYDNVTEEGIYEIYDEIYKNICFDLIESDVSPFVENANNYFVANDDLYMFIDNELIEGAILQLEYIINIKCAMNISQIELQSEVDSKLNFNPSAKMITEDKTNSDYGWQLNSYLSNKKGHNLVVSLNQSSNPIIKSGGSYQAKILYDCILTSKEDLCFSNYITFRLDEQSNLTGKLESMDVNIIPPFGQNHSNHNVIIIIIILGTIGIIILKKITQKK